MLSHIEKHNKLHDLSDSNGHFQKIMSISFNSHIKGQQIRSIYHITDLKINMEYFLGSAFTYTQT